MTRCGPAMHGRVLLESRTRVGGCQSPRHQAKDWNSSRHNKFSKAVIDGGMFCLGTLVICEIRPALGKHILIADWDCRLNSSLSGTQICKKWISLPQTSTFSRTGLCPLCQFARMFLSFMRACIFVMHVAIISFAGVCKSTPISCLQQMQARPARLQPDSYR